jgi:hypothetical protein
MESRSSLVIVPRCSGVSDVRIIIAGIVGGIAMFVWTSIAHVALPLGQVGLSRIPNEKPVISAMQDSIGSRSGLYFFPWTDMKSSNAMAQAEAKLKVSPSGLLVYHPPGAGGMTAQMLIIEFVKELAVSIIAAFLLAQTVLAAYAARAGFVALIGLAAGLTTNVSYWNWYGFPTDYTIASAAIEIIGYIAAGLAVAAILRPRPAS